MSQDVGFCCHCSTLESSECHKVMAHWDGAECMDGQKMGLKGCRVL